MCLQGCGHQLFARCMKFPHPLAKLQVPPKYQFSRHVSVCPQFPENLIHMLLHRTCKQGWWGPWGDPDWPEGARCWQLQEGTLRSVEHVSWQELMCTHTSAFPCCLGSSCEATSPWCSLSPQRDGECHSRAQRSALWPCQWLALVSITAL